MKRWGAARRPDSPEAPTEDLVSGGIALISTCFGAGLLAAAQFLPVQWQQGQVLVLAILLAVLPATVVMTTRQLAGMVGIPAADYARRVAIARWVVVAALAGGLPFYQERLLHGDNSSTGALESMAVGVALCWLVTGMAARLTRSWAMLQVQPWEVGKAEADHIGAIGVEHAGRVDRARVVNDLWRGWLAGGGALALALLLRDQLAPAGHPLARIVGLAAFVLYSGCGLLLLGQMARARQVVYWRLAGTAAPTDLEQSWSRMGLRVAFLALATIALVLIVHGLDAAHAVVAGAIALVVPLLEPLGNWLQDTAGGVHGNCGTSSTCGPAPHRAAPITPQKPPAHTSTPQLPDWLAHSWAAILALLILAVLLHAYRDARRLGTGRGIWREMLAILLRDLRTLWRILWQPAQRALAQVLALQRAAGDASGRRVGRRDRIDWSQPRRALIAIYLAALALAARRGYPRRPGQTAAEYAHEMTARLPATGETIAAMTDAFAAARYGQTPVDQQDVYRMQGIWATLRAILRKAHRG